MRPTTAPTSTGRESSTSRRPVPIASRASISRPRRTSRSSTPARAGADDVVLVRAVGAERSDELDTRFRRERAAVPWRRRRRPSGGRPGRPRPRPRARGRRRRAARRGAANESLQNAARELDRVRVDNDVDPAPPHDRRVHGRRERHGRLPQSGGRAGARRCARSTCAGARCSDALPERLRPLRDAVLDTLRRAHAARARRAACSTTRPGRPLPLGISTNLLTHDGAVTGVVAVFQDLTEVREMERRARRNETLAEVGALAAGIAHELRNGLNPISGSVECLQRELRLEGENAVLMELIADRVRAAQPLRHRPAELLARARSGAGAARPGRAPRRAARGGLRATRAAAPGSTVRSSRRRGRRSLRGRSRADPPGVAQPRRQRARGDGAARAR